MKTAVFLDYKPTRYEGKGFLRNLNIKIHKDITGEMWFGGEVVIANREQVQRIVSLGFDLRSSIWILSPLVPNT